MTTDLAEVFKAGRHAATLTRTVDGVQFNYLPDYLGAAGAIPIASTLPLTDQPRVTAAGAVPPYFAGLLPEGRRRSNRRCADGGVDGRVDQYIRIEGIHYC